MNRYRTWDEAKEGHEHAVSMCREEILETKNQEREQQRAERAKQKALDDKYAASKGPRRVKL